MQTLIDEMPFSSPLFWIVLVAGALGSGALFQMLRNRAALERLRRAEAEVDLGAVVDARSSDPYMHGSFSDRRSSPRRRGSPVSVLIADADASVHPVRGWVVDRSAHGLGLELEEEGEVDVGTILSVRPSNDVSAFWVRVEVRNRQQAGSIWRLGCKYVRLPSTDARLKFG